MKILSLILAAVLLLSVLAGCGGQTGNTAQNNTAQPAENTQNNSNTENTQNTANTENTVPAENSAENTNTAEPENTAENTEDVLTEEDNKWISLYASANMNAETFREYLNGNWTLLNCGGIPQQGSDLGILSFDNASDTMTFSFLENNSYVTCSYTPEKIFEGQGNAFANDYISVNVESASDSIRAKVPDLIDSAASFQVFTASVEGNDMLAVREIGNGYSVLGMEIFGLDTQSSEGTWVFMREGGSKSKLRITPELEAEMRQKSTSFYALLWMDFNDSFYLQAVNTSQSEQIFYEDPISVTDISYMNNGAALYALYYQVEGTEPGILDGGYTPQLVYVTVNENSEITYIDLVPYIGMGLYSQDHIPMYMIHDTSDRPAMYFAETDEIFLGSWKLTSDENSELDIEEASPQTGGYFLTFRFFGVGTAECYANVNIRKDLTINQGFINGKYLIGEVSETETGIKFEVTDSDYELVPVGSVYEYVRK